MALTAARVRALALKLENTEEKPHFDRAAFRTPKRIFMTMAADGKSVNFMFDALTQEHYCAMGPEAFAPVPGGWGAMGATTCTLKAVDLATFRSALAAAHARAMAPAPKPKRSKS